MAKALLVLDMQEVTIGKNHAKMFKATDEEKQKYQEISKKLRK